MHNNCDFSDIINLKRPKSKFSKMSISDKASIYAPFDALNGHGADVLYEDIKRIEEVKNEIEKKEIESI